MVISSPGPLLALTLCLAVLLLYLFFETILLKERLKKIPLRICVTGTRGKSSLTRLIASILREAGYVVLAKTTGSKPDLILPDGQEKEIVRPGQPSILEQKKIVTAGAKARADALVVEMMSIKAECLRVESRKLLKPHILIITNVRLDHLDDMGRTKPEIAKSLAAAISAGCTVLVPEDESHPFFEEAAGKTASRIMPIFRTPAQQREVNEARGKGREFEENLRLALAVSDFLKIDPETARRGIEKSQPDFGSLKVFRIRLDHPERTWYMASLFAANDPESSDKALSHLKRRGTALPEKMIGILNLRRDRGDRSLQWFRALENGFFKDFQKLIFIGDHALALARRKWPGQLGLEISALSSQDAQKIMDGLFVTESGDVLLVGLGNMGGVAAELVKYWARIGGCVS